MTNHIIATTVAIITIYGRLPAQNCPANTNAPITSYCVQGKNIITNPANPINPECSTQLNNFDWRIKHAPGSSVPDERYWVYYLDDNNPTWIRNPFNGPIDATYTPFITANHGSNYQPEDGWELLKVDFGSNGNIGLGVDVKPGANTSTNSRPKLPYMMLYNRYTGTLRFFGSLLEPDNTYETVRIELRVPKPNNGTTTTLYQANLKATNLLSMQGESIQPLDQETIEDAMVVFIKYTNNPQVFFWFDVPVAYDPCLCNNRSQLDVSFRFVQTADIDITGSINGSIKTEKKGTEDYAQMIFSRVLAAGVSGAAAIATQGAVINVKAFIDLIDIISIGKTTDEQASLASLKNYLTCSEKLFSTVKGNIDDVLGKDDKKKLAAGLKIIDGSATLFSSFVSGCNNVDNGATTITGAVNASGTFTLDDEIQSTRITMALPGSKWNDKELQSTSYFDNDGKLVPAYPTYNERLGVFALLETPMFRFHYQNDTCSQLEPLIFNNGIPQNMDRKVNLLVRHTYSLRLDDNLKYAFNPKVNINEDETEIYVRLVIKEDAPLFNNYGNQHINNDSSMDCLTEIQGIRTLNMQYNYNSEFKINSPFVPIDYFKNLPLRFNRLLSSSINNIGLYLDQSERDNIAQAWEILLTNPEFENRMFLQFKVLGKSNNMGSNGKPVEIYHLFTYPIKTISTISDPNALVTKGNFVQDVLDIDVDRTFNVTEDLFYEGPVFISSKISTSNNAKVRIYSLRGFEIQPGAEISPDIELIVGVNVEPVIQPSQNTTEISTFCSNNNKYKADQFAGSAIQLDKNTIDQHSNSLRSETDIPFNLNIFPNPASSYFTVEVQNTVQHPFSLAIIDITGRIIKRIEFDGTSLTEIIHTNSIKSGLYYIVVSCNGNKNTKRLLITNN